MYCVWNLSEKRGYVYRGPTVLTYMQHFPLFLHSIGSYICMKTMK